MNVYLIIWLVLMVLGLPALTLGYVLGVLRTGDRVVETLSQIRTDLEATSTDVDGNALGPGKTKGTRKSTSTARRVVWTSELAAQYNARLYEVRRYLVTRGWCIDRVGHDTGRGENAYRLVPLSESTFYAQYKERLLCGH